MKQNLKTHSVAIIGEVLFDHFPNGHRVLGGAPFNVAWNLCGLGVQSILLSAIGSDDEGAEILTEMKQWGLPTDGVQVDQSLPTGSVVIDKDQDGEPRYDIRMDVAYDELSVKHSATALSNWNPGILYHGSLCFRTKLNRKYLRTVKDYNVPNRFVDLNLREPWTDRNWILQIIDGCQWLKLSSDELAWLSRHSVDAADTSSVQAAVRTLETQSHESSPTYLITCGKHGAHWINQEQSVYTQSKEIGRFVDSVGAGDAFSAAVIRGLVQEETPENILNDAVEFASRACTIEGATTKDRDHYQPPFGD